MKRLSLLIASTVLLWACEVTENENPLRYESLDDFVLEEGPHAYQVTLDFNLKEVSLMGPLASKVRVYPSDLITLDGDSPTGNVYLQIREFHSLSDYVLGGLGTLSHLNQPISAGPAIEVLGEDDFGNGLKQKSKQLEVDMNQQAPLHYEPSFYEVYFSQNQEISQLKWNRLGNDLTYDSLGFHWEGPMGYLGCFNPIEHTESPKTYTVTLSPELPFIDDQAVVAFISPSTREIVRLKPTMVKNQYSTGSIVLPNDFQGYVVGFGIGADGYPLYKDSPFTTGLTNFNLSLNSLKESHGVKNKLSRFNKN